MELKPNRNYLVDIGSAKSKSLQIFWSGCQNRIERLFSGDIRLSEVLINPGINAWSSYLVWVRAEDSAELLSSPKIGKSWFPY